jgi:hypothetical protein
VFSKNRDRLLEGDIAAKFLAAVLAQPFVERSLLGRWHADRSLGLDEERQAEGRLWRAAAVRQRGNAEVNFHGQKRSNDTHASATDRDARLYRKGKGKETKLCFI